MLQNLRLLIILAAICMAVKSQNIHFPDSFENEKPTQQSSPAIQQSFNKHQITQSLPKHQLFKQASEQGAEDNIETAIAQGILKMTLDMDRIISPSGGLASEEDNVVLSPTSIALALALVMLGSSGQTLTEVTQVLGLEDHLNTLNHRDLVHDKYGNLLRQFDDVPKTNATTLTAIATAVFIQRGLQVRARFQRISRSVYRSDVVQLDFVGANVDAGHAINRWVESRTHGRMKGFLRTPPPANTKVLLASALYFNGEWEHPFSIENTRTRPFYVSDAVDGIGGETVPATMMVNAFEIPYFNDPNLGCQIVTLPYKGQQMAMHIVLPNARGIEGLHKLKDKLTVSNLENLISSTRVTSTIISLPRMKITKSISLKSVLSVMGLNSLFNPHLSDLSEMSAGTKQNLQTDQIFFSNRFGDGNATSDYPNGSARQQRVSPNARGSANVTHQTRSLNPRLYADDVNHKVEIEVTETGTVAAAATAVTITRSGDQRVLRMDRPFIFFIRHEKSKLLLFWGAVVRPTQ